METPRLFIGQYLLQRILEHCLEEKPYEACGILTGIDRQVLHAYGTDNAKRSPVFYQVDESQQAEVLRITAASGQQLIGIYHSHPSSSATPSSNDIQMAVYYPDALRVIISLLPPIEVRAYLIQQGKVHPVPLVALQEATGEWHDLRQA